MDQFPTEPVGVESEMAVRRHHSNPPFDAGADRDRPPMSNVRPLNVFCRMF
jgi:hypothetical protein